jgi:hypothetical protein
VTVAAARADDFGPRGDVREVRFDAQRLLAHSVRGWKLDPSAISISDAVVVKNAALLSWRAGARRGLIGLIRDGSRWWDALAYTSEIDGWLDAASYPLPPKCSVTAQSRPDAGVLVQDGLPKDLVDVAALHISLLRAAPPVRSSHVVLADRLCGQNGGNIDPGGGTLWQIPSYTAGYDILVAYGKNTSVGQTESRPLYARAPTQAEIIPYPTTYHFVSNAVAYFDLTIDGAKPVTFAPGTTVEIWFPFVLDDALRYDLTVGFADRPIGPIYAKPFDNVLQYTLPEFTVTPGRTLMAEIDGNWP